MKKQINFLCAVALVGVALFAASCGSKNEEQVGTVGQMVDLGLSVKWADHNVGAIVPEDFGNHYAWGEIHSKDFYGWNTYAHGSDYNKITKYCNDAQNGVCDDKLTLDLEDDVARAAWGGTWRMPTLDEARELIDSCSWNLVEKNGVKGYLVVGRNSNSIFLPAAGYRSNDGHGSVGVYGYYWTKSLYEGIPSVAYELIFNTYSIYTQGDYRFDGRSVRPVCE